MKVAVADYYYEKVELPSRGRFYENLKEVHLRPMTGVEQDILTTERLIKEGKALDMVLSNCLREKVDIEELLVADYMYLLFKLRVLTYGDEYRFEMKCPQCGAINDVEIVLNVEEGVREGDIESEPVEVPLPNGLAMIVLPRVKHQKAVEKNSKIVGAKVQKLISETETLFLNEIILDLKLSYIKDDIPKKEKAKLMLAKDRVAIKKFLIEHAPSFAPVFPFECGHCGYTKELDVPITATFFFPELEG